MNNFESAVGAQVEAFRPDKVPPFEAVLARRRRVRRTHVAGASVLTLSGLALGATLVVGTGPGNGSDSLTQAAPSPSAAATTQPEPPLPVSVPSAPTVVDPVDLPMPSYCGASPATVELSAQCLYEAWTRDDAEAAGPYGTESAVSEMFEVTRRGVVWEYLGCGRPEHASPTSGTSCLFSIPGDVHPVRVEFSMAKDLRVEALTFVG